MRYFYFLVLIVFMSSCAHNTIRLVKTKARPEVIAVNPEHPVHINQDKIEFSKASSPHVTAGSDDNQNRPNTRTHNDDLLEQSSKSVNEDYTSAVDDTLTRPRDAYIYEVAMRAEKDATTARVLFVSSIVMLIIPLVSLFSFIPFIIGWVYLSRADNAPYITKKGQRDSDKARKARLGYLIFIAVLILLVALLLMFLL